MRIVTFIRTNGRPIEIEAKDVAKVELGKTSPFFFQYLGAMIGRPSMPCAVIFTHSGKEYKVKETVEEVLERLS